MGMFSTAGSALDGCPGCGIQFFPLALPTTTTGMMKSPRGPTNMKFEIDRITITYPADWVLRRRLWLYNFIRRPIGPSGLTEEGDKRWLRRACGSAYCLRCGD